jgi:hypothetical protein
LLQLRRPDAPRALRLALWAALALAWCLPAVGHLRDDAWDYDEGPLLQAAALARDGAPLYAEVSLNKPPMLVALVRLGFALGHPDVPSGRLAVLAITLVGFVSLGLLGDALFAPPAGLLTLAALLCVDQLMPRAAVVMPDLPALSLAALGLLCMHRYTVVRRDRWWALSAVSLAAAVTTHPLVAGVALPLAALALGGRVLPPRRRWRALVGVGVLAPALVALCLLPFDRAGMRRWLFDYNLAVRITGNELTGSSVTLLGRYLRSQWPAVALALGSAAWLAREQSTRAGVRVVGLWCAATLLTLALWQPLWDNYLAWALVPAALLSGGGLAGLARRVADRRGPTAARAVALSTLVLLGLALAPRALAWRGRSSTLAAVARDLQSVTAAGECVVSDDPFVVFVAGRRVPPPLADTSAKSITTGFLDSARALAATRRYRVRVVLLGTDRLTRLDAFVRAVRAATVEFRTLDHDERLLLDPARLR